MKFDPSLAQNLMYRVLMDAPKYGSQDKFNFASKMKEWNFFPDKTDREVYEIARQYKKHFQAHCWTHPCYDTITHANREKICELLKVQCGPCPEELKGPTKPSTVPIVQRIDGPNDCSLSSETTDNEEMKRLNSSYLGPQSNDTKSSYLPSPVQQKGRPTTREFFVRVSGFLESVGGHSVEMMAVLTPWTAEKNNLNEISETQSQYFVNLIACSFKYEFSKSSHKCNHYDLKSLKETLEVFIKKIGGIIDISAENLTLFHSILGKLEHRDRGIDINCMSAAVKNFISTM